MKYVKAFAMSSIVVWLAGCASAPNGRVVERTGRSVAVQTAARVRAPIDPNKEEFLWDNDFGRNDFLYESADP